MTSIYCPPRAPYMSRFPHFGDMFPGYVARDDMSSEHVAKKRFQRHVTTVERAESSTVSLYLVERGLLGAPILYLSRYIIQNKDNYYRILLGVTREGSWEAWIVYMLNAVAETSAWTLKKILAVRDLISETREHVRASLPKIYTAELVEQLFALPYSRISHLVAAGLAQRQAASRHLSQLVGIRVLEEQQHGRDKLFVNTRFLSLLSTEGNEYAPLR